jgi:Protein of unknown function DUF2834
MPMLYLILAVIGAIVPYLFFVEHFAAAGLGLGAFLGAAFANGAAGGFSADVLISSVVFWCYLVSRKVPLTWLYVLINLGIGLSCALPLYLFMTARRDAAGASKGPAIA